MKKYIALFLTLCTIAQPLLRAEKSESWFARNKKSIVICASIAGASIVSTAAGWALYRALTNKNTSDKQRQASGTSQVLTQEEQKLVNDVLHYIESKEPGILSQYNRESITEFILIMNNDDEKDGRKSIEEHVLDRLVNICPDAVKDYQYNSCEVALKTIIKTNKIFQMLTNSHTSEEEKEKIENELNIAGEKGPEAVDTVYDQVIKIVGTNPQ